MTVEDLIKSYLSIWLSDFQDRMNNAGIAVPHVHWPFVSWWYRYSETLPVEHASVQTPEICIAFLFSLQDGRAAVIFCSSLLNLESACNSDLRHSLSMKIDCDLLRGVSLATSLSAWGRHWSSSGGTSMCFGFQGESEKQAWLYDTASPDMQCQTRQFNYRAGNTGKGNTGNSALTKFWRSWRLLCDSTDNLLISLDRHKTGPYQLRCQVRGGLKQFEPLNAFHGIHKQIQRCCFKAFFHWIFMQPMLICSIISRYSWPKVLSLSNFILL